MKKFLNDSGAFNRISREVITNPGLSLKAKGLLTLILGFPDEWEFSVSGLSQFLLEGREAILSAMHELIQKGYATRTSIRAGNGRFGKYDYSFFESPQTASPLMDKPVPGMPQKEEPAPEVPQQLRSNESITNLNKQEKIKVLLAHEPFLLVWKELTATPKWTKKTSSDIETELASLADYTPGEATALVKAALHHRWGNAVYDNSSKKILEKYHREHSVTPFPINPPRLPEPALPPDEIERRNREALISMSCQLFKEVREKGRILATVDLPVAHVFDFLLSTGAISASAEQLEAVKKKKDSLEQYAAKRKLLEEIFAEKIAAGEGLTIPSKEGSEVMFR